MKKKRKTFRIDDDLCALLDKARTMNHLKCAIVNSALREYFERLDKK